MLVHGFGLEMFNGPIKLGIGLSSPWTNSKLALRYPIIDFIELKGDYELGLRNKSIEPKSINMFFH